MPHSTVFFLCKHPAGGGVCSKPCHVYEARDGGEKKRWNDKERGCGYKLNIKLAGDRLGDKWNTRARALTCDTSATCIYSFLPLPFWCICTAIIEQTVIAKFTRATGNVESQFRTVTEYGDQARGSSSYITHIKHVQRTLHTRIAAAPRSSYPSQSLTRYSSTASTEPRKNVHSRINQSWGSIARPSTRQETNLVFYGYSSERSTYDKVAQSGARQQPRSADVEHGTIRNRQ